MRRSYQSQIFDSDRWVAYRPRAGDVVVSTSVKAGTTWAQQIVASLLWPGGELPRPLNELSPWFELPVRPIDDVVAALDAQPGPRIIKSHLPADGLPIHDEVRYITVGRDGRDVFVSLMHHWASMREVVFDGLRLVRPGHEAIRPFHGDIHQAFDDWVSRGAFPWESDGYPWHSHLAHVASWWELRHQPNVLLLHYDELLDDLEGQMRRVASFLGVDLPAQQWPDAVERCTLAGMRRRWQDVVPERAVFEEDGARFFHRGTSGQWCDELTADEVARYDNREATVLTSDARGWLTKGETVAETPRPRQASRS